MQGVAVGIAVFACLGQFVLALVALRSGRSPLALPLALLCLDLFTWNAASLIFDLSGQLPWRWLDLSTSPLSTPLTFDFVLTFVGKRRRLRWLRATYYAAFGILSAASALAFVLPAARAFAGSNLWAALHLGGLIPGMAFAVVLLVAHLTQAIGEEKARTQLLLAAVAIGAALGSTELVNDFIPSVPSLGAVGVLAGTTLMTVAAMRVRLLESQLSAGTLAAALMIAGLSVLAYLAVFRVVAGNTALLVFGVAIVSLALMAATRQLVAVAARRRARRAELASLGRFSAQMAHDLKNPLAALKGATQFLQEQLARERAGSDRAEFGRLILDQVDRVQRVVDRYQRLSQVQLVRAPVAINDVVRDVLSLQSFAGGGRVAVRAELAQPSPVCDVDRDLIAAALENLVRNAFEAMHDGGALTVRTEAAESELILSVEDTGPGMDARTRERAFDEFFSTKATGSGLGLPFVRRVVEAHGGKVSLITGPGRGTVVELRLLLK